MVKDQPRQQPHSSFTREGRPFTSPVARAAKPVYPLDQLTLYETCALSYRYRYLDHLQASSLAPSTLESTLARQRQSIEHFLEARIRQALERLYRDLLHTRLLSLEEWVAGYEKDWLEHWDTGIQANYTARSLAPDLAPEDFLAMGRRCLEDFYRRYAPFDQDRTLLLEEPFELDLYGDSAYIVSFPVERVAVAPDGSYVVHLTSVASAIPGATDWRTLWRGALACLAVQRRFSPVAGEVKVIRHDLVFNREEILPLDQEALSQLILCTSQVIDQVENSQSQQLFPFHESAYCEDCPFYSLCPAKQHTNRLVRLLPLARGRDVGVRLADQYVTLHQERQRLRREYRERLARIQAQMREAEETLLDYAQRQGLGAIQGTEHQVAIKEQLALRFPPGLDGERRREALEHLLRLAGLWHTVAQLDETALRRAFAAGGIPPAVREAALELVEVEIQPRLEVIATGE
ncbi:MAG: hypothetical protein EXR62_15005 [Chloroflexi bacterium]|nr:hypothetical protein [Chloroflexota bacterium]